VEGFFYSKVLTVYWNHNNGGGGRGAAEGFKTLGNLHPFENHSRQGHARLGNYFGGIKLDRSGGKVTGKNSL